MLVSLYKGFNMFIFLKKLIQNTVQENFVKNYIEKKYNVKVEKIKKQKGKTYAVLENNVIYSNKIPDIIEFVSDNDYRQLLMFYGAYQRENIDKMMNKPYPYNKYDWNTLMEIIWVNQYYNKHLQEFKRAGIKKAKLIITIVDRNKTEFYADVISGFESNLQMVMYGNGTAPNTVLQNLGLNNEKGVILSVVRTDMIKKVLNTFNKLIWSY
mgnify:CR=1 FL=1